MQDICKSPVIELFPFTHSDIIDYHVVIIINIINVIIIPTSTCHMCRNEDATSPKNISVDDNKESKSRCQKSEATSGGDPVYFNSISRSACPL